MNHEDQLPDVFAAMANPPGHVDIRICEGLFVRHAVFPEGTYIPTHSHEHEHLTIIATGAVRAWADGELLGDFAAPNGIVIKRHVKHTFMALKPDTAILCIHRVGPDGDPEIFEEHRVKMEGA